MGFGAGIITPVGIRLGPPPEVCAPVSQKKGVFHGQYIAIREKRDKIEMMIFKYKHKVLANLSRSLRVGCKCCFASVCM